MNYLAIATSEDHRGISTTALIQEVLRRWPQARIEQPDRGPYAIRWAAKATRGDIAGALFRDGLGLGLDGELEDCAEMTIWFRRAIGTDVTFADQAYNGSVVVDENVTSGQLVEQYLESEGADS